MKCLGSYGVSFAKQITKTLVEIITFSKPKVVDKVAVEQRLDAKHQRMGSRSLEPDVPSEVTLARRD